jgi:hypothetical protein
MFERGYKKDITLAFSMAPTKETVSNLCFVFDSSLQLISQLTRSGMFWLYEHHLLWNQNCGEKRDCTLVCVFDGHGPNGGRVAAWLCRNLLKIVRKNLLPEIPMQDVFTTSFEVAYDQITRSGFDVSMRCVCTVPTLPSVIHVSVGCRR